ncbi:hypothetical protein [Kineobactrum salinum]|uniref:Uncharacterized protein n=1 Tax=Kineobactrum salinum TaxID=2708301 RepID=A0A6C0U616_9GAMM|nr:hypothetical protein [Kineobactrum salinum]QIB66377.1 hypothetical protein G3T16_14210 [Kineobactrum salinum]
MSVTHELNKLAYFDGLGLQLLVAQYPLTGAAPSAPGYPWPPRKRASAEAPGMPAATGPESISARTAPTGMRGLPKTSSGSAARAGGEADATVPEPPAGMPRLHTTNDSAAVAGRQADTAPPEASVGKPQLQTASEGAAVAGPEPNTAAPVAPAGMPRLQAVRDNTTVALSPAASSRAAAQSVPEFHMAAVVAGDCLWLEAVNAGGPAAEQIQLIQAMAFALSGRQETARLTRFDWPLHQNRQLDLGEAAAATALTSFVLRQLQEKQCRALVLLGATSGERLLPVELEAVTTVSLPATAEMLAQPLRKREAWEALAVLCPPVRS